MRHFDSKPSAGQVRDVCTFEIVTTINPFSFMSGVWSYECRLFMEEKVEILKAKIDNLQSLNNENLDIYGPYRNRAKFRMYLCIGELCDIEKNNSKDKKTKSLKMLIVKIGNPLHLVPPQTQLESGIGSRE